jgi:transcriptional regulator GlxA family with amidase domain
MRVAILAPSDTLLLEVVGPYDVFASANELLGSRPDYELTVIAPDRGPITGACGLRLVADRTIADADVPIDTLLVAGPRDVDKALVDPSLISWVERRAPAIPRYGSVCTGAFILAAANLLDGRRATTHWQYAERLSREFPAVKVEPDCLFVHDGPAWTSAGVTSGIDLALALVEEDHGRELALAVARQLVLFLKRPGSQSQYSVQLAAQSARKSNIESAQAWTLDHLASDLSTGKLAAHAGMSLRNFSRVFQAEARITPARFVEAARIDAARRMLEETALPLKKIATYCGFVTVGRMRQAFIRRVDTSPLDYRRRVRSLHE